MIYGARPSPIFDMKKAGNAFAADVAKTQDFPKDWDGVKDLYGFQFQYADGVDLDQTGLLVKNAVACFMNMEETVMTDWFTFWRKWLHGVCSSTSTTVSL